MQQQDNHEYPFLYQRQTCHQVLSYQATEPNQIYTLSLHDALPIFGSHGWPEIVADGLAARVEHDEVAVDADRRDRKSTRLNSSHVAISYAVFCLKKKKITSILSFISSRLATKS